MLCRVPELCKLFGSRRTCRTGISHVEVLVCIPLVGVMLVSAMNSTGSIVRTWNFAHDQHRARAIAENLMAEILQQQYEEPDDTPTNGRESGESAATRLNWDDVDDYNGWSQSPPADKSDTVLSGYVGWSRAVSIAYVELNDPTQTTADDEGVKRITVTVTNPTAETIVLVAYRSKWGALEERPLLNTNIQGFVSHELEASGSTFHDGVQLPNHSEDE